MLSEWREHGGIGPIDVVAHRYDIAIMTDIQPNLQILRVVHLLYFEDTHHVSFTGVHLVNLLARAIFLRPQSEMQTQKKTNHIQIPFYHRETLPQFYRKYIYKKKEMHCYIKIKPVNASP